MIQEPVSTTFLLPDTVTGEQVWHNVRSPYAIERARHAKGRRRYYDTFDWRLYRDGLALLWERDRYELRSLSHDEVLASLEAVGQKRFWWEFRDGPLKDRLRECLEERALIPLVNIDIDRKIADVLNEDRKTVARVAEENIRLPSGDARSGRVRTMTLQPVRGYRRDFRFLHGNFSSQGLDDHGRLWFDVVLERSGKIPCDYSSKLKIKLKPGMQARAAAVAIFRRLLDTIQRNEQGVCQDIDTEFLHDFRVAVRRTRAGLSQIKDVFPGESIRRFKADFSKLGKLSNRLRDLDVYLLSKDEYGRMLPPPLRSALQPMFDALGHERSRELERVAETIKGGDYRTRLNEWREFLDNPAVFGPDAANAAVPVDLLARRWIWRRYRRVLRKGRAIDGTSPDADLHALRIEGKKLRYLLEFFASLFPATEITTLVKQLKKLQDNLGEFNDLSLQQVELKRWLAQAGLPSDTAGAIGGLITELNRRQGDVRRQLAQTFKGFASARNASAYRKLFNTS
jgi:CHAD domain-containing protein